MWVIYIVCLSFFLPILSKYILNISRSVAYAQIDLIKSIRLYLVSQKNELL